MENIQPSPESSGGVPIELFAFRQFPLQPLGTLQMIQYLLYKAEVGSDNLQLNRIMVS